MMSLRSFSLSFSPSKRIGHSFKPSRTPSSINMSSTPQTVEHVVLFKVKDDTQPSKVNAMVNGLNSLFTLHGVLHLSVGPLIQCRASNSELRYTHMLHSRYGSKEDLQAYSAHPDHLGVVRGSVLPICDDIMAVDWVAAGGPAIPPPQPGSAMRVSLLKLKESEGEAKDEVLNVFGEEDISEVSWGENFSPARGKGFSIASLVVFPGLRELEGVEWNEGLVKKVGEHVESVVVVDYVIPSRVVLTSSV